LPADFLPQRQRQQERDGADHPRHALGEEFAGIPHCAADLAQPGITAGGAEPDRQQLGGDPPLLLGAFLFRRFQLRFGVGDPLRQRHHVGHRQILALLEFLQQGQFLLQACALARVVIDRLSQILGAGIARTDPTTLARQRDHRLHAGRNDPHRERRPRRIAAGLIDRQHFATSESRAGAGRLRRPQAPDDRILGQDHIDAMLVGQHGTWPLDGAIGGHGRRSLGVATANGAGRPGASRHARQQQHREQRPQEHPRDLLQGQFLFLPVHRLSPCPAHVLATINPLLPARILKPGHPNRVRRQIAARRILP